MKAYAIENKSGQWWDGDGWGVKENRELYTSISGLPDELEGMDINVFATPECGGSLDISYYPATDDDGRFACVKELTR